METQNVSAQLYNKQLPMEQRATYYGCNANEDITSPFLTTCVDPVESENSIENAFQEQMGLAEYYKSPGVFESMKNDYSSKTMDFSNLDDSNILPVSIQPTELTDLPEPGSLPDTVERPEVGPTDFLKETLNRSKEMFNGTKSRFGSSTGGNIAIALLVVFLILAAIAVYLIYLKK